MNPIPEPSKIGPVVQRKSALKSTFSKSALATAIVLLGLLGTAGYFSGGSSLIPPVHHGDVVTEKEAQDRLSTFSALAPMPLDIIKDKDIGVALNSMDLPSPAKQELQQKAAPTAALSGNDRVKLAWITLWDTDVQDGDVVQINSQGYSRTVVLAKAPVTFAIPVPADGIVNVTGIKDGDGGGITVGLASGGAQAVFPVMSEGQTLGLKVRMP